MALKTDYKDYIPPAGGRVYRPEYLTDGTMRLADVTPYQQEGDTFGAAELNFINSCLANMGYNLLDNSDFTNAVNQRGATSYSGGGVYSIDRWKVYLTTLTVGADSCTILRTGVGGAFYQYVIADTTLIYTFTAKTSDGIISVTGIPTENPEKTLGNTAIRISTFGAYVQISIWTVNTTDAVTLYWVKLELGTVATPYVPKGYGIELSECRRYYQQYNQTITLTWIGVDQVEVANLMFTPPMRIIPTLTAIGVYGKVDFAGVSTTGAQLTNSQMWNGGYNYCTGVTASADL